MRHHDDDLVLQAVTEIVHQHIGGFPVEMRGRLVDQQHVCFGIGPQPLSWEAFDGYRWAIAQNRTIRGT